MESGRGDYRDLLSPWVSFLRDQAGAVYARHKFIQLYEDDMMSIWIFKKMMSI